MKLPDWRHSLRFELLRWLLIPLVALLAVNAFFSNRAAVATANTAFDRLLIASADAIADQVSLQDGELRVDLPYVALQLLESKLQERVFYRVVAPGGQTLTGYDDLPLPPPLPPVTASPRQKEPPVQVLYSATYRGESVYLVAMYRTVYGAQAQPEQRPAVVVVAETGESRDALSKQILVEGLLRQAVLIGAAGLLLWFSLGRGLRPLVRLRKALLARSPADLSPIDQHSVQTEVRPLIEALNQHTGRIEKLLASRERFVADASHQMRTPLAEMRTQIEYSLRQPTEADQQDSLARQTLHDVRHGIDALSRTIAQMLLLARSDPEVLDRRQHTELDLTALTRDTALQFVAAARQKNADLGFEEGTARVRVRGNAQLLHEMVANLIDNALRYTAPSGVVRVRVRLAPEPVLEVEDNGPGIAADERERVFERFYRGGGGGGAGSEGGGDAGSSTGSGLGLSIVRDICLSHHATVTLDTPEHGSGLCVRVRFAAMPPGRSTGAAAA